MPTSSLPLKMDRELEIEIAGELVMDFGKYGFETFEYFGGAGFIQRLLTSK